MKTLLKTIIVDDAASARRSLVRRLEDQPDIELVGQARGGQDALQMIREMAPDLVFLDIQMPGMDGFDVLRALDEDRVPVIVFVTAFDEFALQALEKFDLNYLSKPLDDEHLTEALKGARRLAAGKGRAAYRRALTRLVSGIADGPSRARRGKTRRRAKSSRGEPQLAIRDGGKTTTVPQGEIDWIDAAGDYMCVHTGGTTHIMRMTMKKLEQQLDPEILQRVHRSTIVNVHRVTGLKPHINGEFFLTLDNGHTVKLSRTYKEKLRFFR